MRIQIGVALALLLCLTPSTQALPEVEYFPFADQTLTVSSTAIGLTASVYAPDGLAPADMAVCNLETDAIRYRLSGLNPTAAVGHYIQAGSATASSTFTIYDTASIRRLRVIRVTNDASLTCTYYRKGMQ